jgi:hypothetical protein
VLLETLQKKSKVIKQRWLAALAAMYPDATAAYLLSEKDRFLNPVGYALARAADDLFEGLLNESGERAGAKESFREAVRILAVQELNPSSALSFIRLLKEEICKELPDGPVAAEDFRELLRLEARLDAAVMDGFDLYVECRDQIAGVRINEVKAERERLARLLAAVTGGSRSAGSEGTGGETPP